MESKDDLIHAIESGDSDESVKLTRTLLSDGSSAQEVLKTVTHAIREVGDAFEKFDIFLPQMMMASNATIEVMKVLEPKLKEEGSELAAKPAKIVMASVKGDMHEIGKNITITLFNANGYDILDMGADVDSLDIVKTAGREKANIIGLSSLMTTTMPGQKEVIDILKDTGQRDDFKVIIGGAPTSEKWADEIGADGWGKDASDAVRLVERLFK